MQGREIHRAWDPVGSNGGRGGEGVTRGLKIGILSLGRRNNSTARMSNERAVNKRDKERGEEAGQERR